MLYFPQALNEGLEPPVAILLLVEFDHLAEMEKNGQEIERN